MNASLYQLSIGQLLLAFVPLVAVAVIYVRWSIGVGSLLYATARMITQLLLIGFVLTYLFEVQHPLTMCGVLMFMFAVASWIALRPLPRELKRQQYIWVLISLIIGAGTTLVIIIAGVIQLKPWYEPRYLIPLAGMIFSTGMNAVSLAAERVHAETIHHEAWRQVRLKAFSTALLPTVNSFFAVGLVALPGMMTGQILSGVEPLIAVRYQIMVMAMVLGSSGLSAGLYLHFVSSRITVDKR